MSTQLTVSCLSRIPAEELYLRLEIFATLCSELQHDFDSPEAFVISIHRTRDILQVLCFERQYTSAELEEHPTYRRDRLSAFGIPLDAPATGKDTLLSSATPQTRRAIRR